MPNSRAKIKYTTDANVVYQIQVPQKYVTLGGFTAADGTEALPPKGLRTRKANLRTYVATAGAVPGHYLERKVPCQAAALAVGQSLAQGAQVPNLDGANWTVQGWTGERLKAIS